MIVAVLPPGIDRGQKVCPARRQFSPIRRRGAIRPMDDRPRGAIHVRHPPRCCRGCETPFRPCISLMIASDREYYQHITDSKDQSISCPIVPNTIVVFFYEQGRMDEDRE
ncbi:hypothetical protein [Azospirillum brasilense]|uniref:hypothetical protein n=1 Tax=Azospirillum brasilense TaxID=192 RepID=UPI001EDB47E8|nr:hypothetical protein [Azospirillum brasilense]UKJ73549.1 hypothetical protein H1Q64_02775 [Azospirillum brasilense]